MLAICGGNWIPVHERTRIAYLLQPYSQSALNRAIKTPKFYFRDTGLACYLTRWLTADALKCSAVAGNMFDKENVLKRESFGIAD